ncbi:MAG: sel1 repeat family protein, partial [Clostridium sp.]
SKSAYAEYPYAQYNLGEMYYHGKGVVKNLDKAYDLYKKAAEHGLKDAQYVLKEKFNKK